MKKKSEPYSRIIYAISRFIITRPIKFMFHMEIIGAENWPKHGPAILAANHSSNMDPPLVCLSYPGYISWMGKSEVLRAPVLGWYLKKVGAFEVRRGEADREAIRRARELLDEGYVVGMFPEGSRQRDGHLGEALPGVGMLALTPGVPVIPVRIRGNDQIVRNGRLHRPKVTVTVGPPVDLEMPEMPEMPKGKSYREASRRIMAAIEAL